MRGPVTMCGENIYLCEGCAKRLRHVFSGWCVNDVGRKACHLCESSPSRLDMVPMNADGIVTLHREGEIK